MNKQNFYADIPADLPKELLESLLAGRAFRMERIVSRGQSSPPGFWYDQDRPEWVLLLKGAARLEFEDRSPIELRPGDYLTIPAHVRHRVAWTSGEEDTFWLAVHYR